MAQFRRDSKRDFKPKASGYTFEFKQTTPQDGGKDINLMISEKAMKDLPKSSYALKQDPYNEINQASTAYPLLAALNKNLGPDYEGKANLEGGTANRFVSSLNTRLNKVIDSALALIGFNYRYLNLNDASSSDNDGIEINAKMMDAISEAVSQLNATTFTENAVVSSYGVRTKLKMPTAYVGTLTYTDSTNYTWYGDVYEKDAGGNIIGVYYTNPAVVIFVMAIMYQQNVQNAALTISTYNKCRSFMGTCLDHQYNKNINFINIFDGQIKKAAFQNLLQTVSLDIQGEYFDVDWFKQINTLTTTPSQKSYSIWDPVLEIIGPNKLLPYVEILSVNKITSTVNGTICSSNTFRASVPTKADPSTTTTMDMESICYNIMYELSIHSILFDARNQGGVAEAVNKYNYLVGLYNGVNDIMTSLKTYFTDLRTVFDVLKRTGIVNWAQDSYPTTFTSYIKIKPEQYRVVDDIFRSTLSGGQDMTYDAQTGNWVIQTPWDMYTGIPAFDSMSGGCFLSFSTKTIISTDTEVRRYIPKLFTFYNQNGNVALVLFRNGHQTVVVRDTTSPAANPDFSRMAILGSQDNVTLSYPKITDTASLILDDVEEAFSEKFLLQTCGTSCVNGRYTMSPSIISLYDVQVVDVQNMMTAYGKTYGPIRGSAGDSPAVGFKLSK